jgi:hypothetical protein
MKTRFQHSTTQAIGIPFKLSTCASALAFSVGLLIGTQSFAQQENWRPPLTQDGHPDLQGVWANNSSTPLERPEIFGNRAELTDEEFRDLLQQAENVRASGGDALFGDGFLNAVITGEVRSYDPSTGNYDSGWMVDRNMENRTSLIIDPPNGRLPPMTEEGRALAQLRASGRLSPTDTYLGRPLQERCITYGMPYIMAGYNSYYQIVQSKTSVAIIQEMIHDVRVIPIGEKPALDERVKLWHGDSRGWYEGNTLVVETKNFSGQSLCRGAGENRTFIERYTRVADDVLEYQLPWKTPVRGKHRGPRSSTTRPVKIQFLNTPATKATTP